jgi:ATP diphosphatase
MAARGTRSKRATIAPYTVEEAYEVADAIERNDLDSLRDELGDRSTHHARMAQEIGAFDFGAVVSHLRQSCAASVSFGGADRIAQAQTRGKQKTGATRLLPGDVPRARRPAPRGEADGARLRSVSIGRTSPQCAKLDEELAELDAELAVAGEAPEIRAIAAGW